MSKCHVYPDSAPVKHAVQLVAGTPGMKSTEFPALLGLSKHFAPKVLQCARMAGLIVAVHIEAYTFGWFPAGPVADKAAKKWKAIAKERARVRNCKGVARLKKARKPENVGAELPGKPVRRYVKANKPLPFVCTAPASVFHLGGML